MELITLSPRDPARLRQTYGCFPSGATGLCALDGSEPRGTAASSFTSVLIEPALVSVCVQHTPTTWPVLRELPWLGISVLAAGQHGEGSALASRADDRFADIDWQATAGGAVLLNDAAAWFECSLEQELPAGDHSIEFLRIHSLGSQADRAPLVFHTSRFRHLADAT